MCPLCNATLRQARNLRRHLELLHFGVGRSTVRLRSRRASAPGTTPAAAAATATTTATATATASIAAATATASIAAATATASNAGNPTSTVHGMVEETRDPNMMAAQRAPTSSLASHSAAPSTTSISGALTLRGTPPAVPHLPTAVQLAQMVPLSTALLDAAPPHLLLPPRPPSPPLHCEAQQVLSSPLRRPEDCSVATAVQSSQLVTSPPHEALFRHHHAELLRGAGLYTDPRALPPTLSALQLTHQPQQHHQQLQQPPPPAHNHSQGPPQSGQQQPLCQQTSLRHQAA